MKLCAESLSHNSVQVTQVIQRSLASLHVYLARNKDLKKLRKETTMCSPALCDNCSKVTWTGCGGHIEEALEGVPQEQLCTCNN
jgi:hypothetical protein